MRIETDEARRGVKGCWKDLIVAVYSVEKKKKVTVMETLDLIFSRGFTSCAITPSMTSLFSFFFFFLIFYFFVFSFFFPCGENLPAAHIMWLETPQLHHDRHGWSY